ncbi:MAG: hypothetical protein WC483_02230 [Candidatus Paceibacterota bacterium]
MGTLFLNKGEEPGALTQVAWGGEAGDITVNGALHVVGNVQIDGNLTLADTTIVDLATVTIYTFADPIINLNTSFTAAFIPEAGFRVYRGPAIPSAYLSFTEDAARTTLVWKAGVGVDVLRIGRVPDAMTDRHAIYWDDTGVTLSSHPNIAFNATEISSAIPSQFILPAGQPYSFYRYNAILDPCFSVERYNAGVLADAANIGFATYTYDATLFTGASVISGGSTLILNTRAPTHDRSRIILQDIASFGIDAPTIALLRTDLAEMRVEGTTTVGLRAGAAGAAQLSLAAALLTSTVDIAFGTQLLTGRDANIDAVASQAYSYYLPAGLEPLPVIGGWPGTITYGGLTSTLTAVEANARTKYEIVIEHTIGVGTGLPYTVFTPINIGGDMANVCSMYGVVRLMAGAVVQRVYSLTSTDLAIEAPFDIDPPFLTAANLVGYHLLSVNMMSVTGTWSVAVTIETRHPLVHAP